jgi:hypothetical protein
MNSSDMQKQLDKPNGPLFKNKTYFTQVKRRKPNPKYKSHGRHHGRKYEIKCTRS